MRNIRVTARNASDVPVDWLSVRYHRLNRWIRESPKPKAEWQEELIVIQAELEARDKLQLINQSKVEQLELGGITITGRDAYVPFVEERLGEHYRMTREYAWLSRQLATPVNDYEANIMLTANYGQLSPGSRISRHSNVEQQVIRKLERYEECQERLHILIEQMLPISTILNTKLTEEQRLLIECKYFTRESPKDEFLIVKFHLGRQKYYNLKKQALIRIAYELGIL